VKRTVTFAAAALVTIGVWLVAFRPGPGRGGELLAVPAAEAASGVSTSPPPSEGETLRLYSVSKGGFIVSHKVEKTEAEWRKELTPEQFRVLREQGTERAFTGHLWDNHEKGVYKCAACGSDLFTSDTKFESGTGWPSFYAPVAPENVETEKDDSMFMQRVEVHCRRCGGHLGHVFDDGPRPTGLRYCINSVSLEFERTGE
jgi:peptide-methionine (R)-S-oxide reductase